MLRAIATIAFLFFGFIFSAATVLGAPERCEGLGSDALSVVEEVVTTTYMYDCCDDTIAACLKQATPCSLATRLREEVCRYARMGKSAKEIRHLLEQRAASMSSMTPTVKIAMTPEHLWGNPSAKVVLSVYLCARCPYCSRHVPMLIDAIEKSPFKDKVVLNLRLFPIKSHDNATPAAIAVEAAAKMGKGWDYLLLSYAHFDEFSLRAISEYGLTLGLDAAEFERLRSDPMVRDAVVAAKKEGFVNNVTTTPTFFLNGRKIQGVFDLEAMMSMIEEAVDQAQ